MSVGLKTLSRSSLVAQQVKDLALSLQQPRSLLWHGFDPWPGNFHTPQARTKKKKKKKITEKSCCIEDTALWFPGQQWCGRQRCGQHWAEALFRQCWWESRADQAGLDQRVPMRQLRENWARAKFNLPLAPLRIKNGRLSSSKTETHTKFPGK